MKGSVKASLLLIAVISAFAQLPADLQRQFDEAERRIVRLPPTAFPELPARRSPGASAPGMYDSADGIHKEPHNVIKGEFAKPGQHDWAVLCSVKGVSTILVFWNGSEKNPAEIAKMEDRIFLQGITADEIGYSRGHRRSGKKTSSCATTMLTVARNRHRLTIRGLTMPSLRRRP